MSFDGPRRLLRPSTLEPVELDLRKVFWAGVLFWLVALVVSSVLTVAGELEGRIPWICATGLVLGLAALVYERRLDR